MLVWHLSCVAVCSNSPELDEDACEHDAEAKGCGSTSVLLTDASPNHDVALSAAQAEASDFLAAWQPSPSVVPDGETCLVELTRRWPLLTMGAGLLSFASVIALWSLARAAPAIIAATCSYASDGACARLFGSMGGSDMTEGLTALALNAATLALGYLVLQSEIQACVVQPPPGMRAASLVGAAAAVASLAYAASMRMTPGFSLEPGAGELAETAGTVAYAMLLSVWNGVRYFCLPPPPDVQDDDQGGAGQCAVADAICCAAEQEERGSADE
jgi:hypothetical protein